MENAIVKVYTDEKKNKRLKFKSLCESCNCGKGKSYLYDIYGELINIEDGEYPIEYFTSGLTYDNSESYVYSLSEEGKEYFKSLN